MLKACPFCGYSAREFQRSDGSGHGESYNRIGVECSQCDAEIGFGGYVGQEEATRLTRAIYQWNCRIRFIEDNDDG